MKKSTLCGVAACLAGLALAAQVPHFNHVPEKLPPDTRLINPKAAEKNHLLIVNVGGALSETDFSTIVTYTLTRVNVNAWTNAIPESCWRSCIDRPELIKKMFGPHATVVVFLEKNQQGFSFMNVPGHWSMINLRGLDKDNAAFLAEARKLDQQIYEDPAMTDGDYANAREQINAKLKERGLPELEERE